MMKMTFKQVGSFEFSQAMAKIENTPTSTKNAGHIHQIVKRVKAGKDRIHEEYKTDIMEKFAKKGEDGKALVSEHQPGGFELTEGQEEAFNEAFKEFEAREVEVDWKPLTTTTLDDVRLSARELELLGPLVVDESGPGVPSLQSVR